MSLEKGIRMKKILLAVNYDKLEDYIAKIEGLEVVSIVNTRRKLINECIDKSPEILLISRNLPGMEDMKDLIIKLTSKNFINLRIIFLYGNEDSEKDKFIDFIISRGIYDYHIGSLDNETLESLLFKPRTRDDVKHDVLHKPSYSNDGHIENHQSESKDPEAKIIVKYIKEYDIPKDYKKIFLFVSPESTGKSEVAANVSISLSENGKKVGLIDFDTENYGLRHNFLKKNEVEMIYFEKLFNEKSDLDMSEIDKSEILDFGYKVNPKLYVFTSKPNIQIEISIERLNYVIRKIREHVDVIIIDVGKNVSKDILNTLLELANIEKFIITTQNLELVERIALKLKFQSNLDYDNWNLVINQFEENVKIDNLEIESILLRESDQYRKFKFKEIFTIPNIYKDILENKKHRDYSYYFSTDEFKNSIDRIAVGWFLNKEEEKEKLINKFNNKIKGFFN